MSLRHMTFSSVIITSVSTFRLLAQFFVLPILARYLSPEDYGVVALALPFIMFSTLFARSGVGLSLLRDKKKDNGVWSTSFWFIMALSLFFVLVIILLAPLVALFFDTPRLSYILIAFAPTILLSALSIIPMAYLRHDRRFAALSITQIVSVAFGLGAAVLIATAGGGAWALVGQGLVTEGLILILTFFASGFRPNLVFRLSIITKHLKFGRDVVGSNFLDLFKNTFRSFIIAKILGTGVLGFYTIAFLFFNMPYRIVTSVLHDVVYTYLVPHKEDKPLLRQMLFFLTRVLSIIILPVMGMVAVAHQPVFSLLLSDKWGLSGELFMIMAPVMALHTVLSVRVLFMLVIGRVDINLRCSVELLLLELVAMMAAIWYGIHAAIIGLVFATLVFQIRNLYFILIHMECTVRSYLSTLALPVFFTLGAAFTYLEFTEIWLDEKNLEKVLVAFILAVGAMAASAGIQYKTIKEEISLLGQLLAQKPEKIPT